VTYTNLVNIKRVAHPQAAVRAKTGQNVLG